MYLTFTLTIHTNSSIMTYPFYDLEFFSSSSFRKVYPRKVVEMKGSFLKRKLCSKPMTSDWVGGNDPTFPSHWAKMTILIFVIENKTQKPFDSSLLALKGNFIVKWKDSVMVASGHTTPYNLQRFFFLYSIFTTNFLSEKKYKTILWSRGKVYLK